AAELGQGTAALHQDRVAPYTIELGDALTPAHFPEAGSLVQRTRAGVLGEERTLQRPDAGGFRIDDQLLEQRAADTASARSSRHVDRQLGDPGVDRARRHGRQCGPTERVPGVIGRDGDAASHGEPPRRPRLPVPRSSGLEGGLAGSYAFEVDGPYRVPVRLEHRPDQDGDRGLRGAHEGKMIAAPGGVMMWDSHLTVRRA